MPRLVGVIFALIIGGYGLVSPTVAQTPSSLPKKSHLLKVSYVQSPASKTRLLIVRQQLKNDRKRYEQLRNKMLNSKIYHSLYIDLESGEMVIVQDSLKVYTSVSVPSVVLGAHKFPNDTSEVIDYFMKVTRSYTVPSSYGLWEIDSTATPRQILAYRALPAKLRDDPDRYAEIWVTTDIQPPRKSKKAKNLYSCGPAYYLGLPGIVLEVENLFGSFKASKIEYLDSRAEIEKALQKFKTVGANAVQQQLQLVQKNYRIFASKILHMLDALQYASQSLSD